VASAHEGRLGVAAPHESKALPMPRNWMLTDEFVIELDFDFHSVIS
jgi:hypothetical protein